MHKNVDEMSDEELCYCLAKAQGYEIVGGVPSLNIVDESTIKQYGYSTWLMYNPLKYAEQFCKLLDKYKPYITYMVDCVVAEVMAGSRTGLYDTELNYATSKDCSMDIKKALCKAIVALHYGYGFDSEELRDE